MIKGIRPSGAFPSPRIRVLRYIRVRIWSGPPAMPEGRLRPPAVRLAQRQRAARDLWAHAARRSYIRHHRRLRAGGSVCAGRPHHAVATQRALNTAGSQTGSALLFPEIAGSTNDVATAVLS